MSLGATCIAVAIFVDFALSRTAVQFHRFTGEDRAPFQHVIRFLVSTDFWEKLAHQTKTFLFHFNFAPFQCRRHIAMLCLVHRCVLEKGTNHFGTFCEIYAAETQHTEW